MAHTSTFAHQSLLEEVSVVDCACVYFCVQMCTLAFVCVLRRAERWRHWREKERGRETAD